MELCIRQRLRQRKRRLFPSALLKNKEVCACPLSLTFVPSTSCILFEFKSAVCLIVCVFRLSDLLRESDRN